jgi:hypothetical protein
MNVKRGIGGLEFVFRDQFKGNDEKVAISRAVVVVVNIYVRFWGIQCECIMWFILRRKYL